MLKAQRGHVSQALPSKQSLPFALLILPLSPALGITSPITHGVSTAISFVTGSNVRGRRRAPGEQLAAQPTKYPRWPSLPLSYLKESCQEQC